LRCRSSSACIAAATSGSTKLNGFNQITVMRQQGWLRCIEDGKIDYGLD
jgi:hypothetical protein